ncbi:MAG TPA: hypothetical protein VII40_01190 [Xanthobacteraceae bacterium]
MPADLTAAVRDRDAQQNRYGRKRTPQPPENGFLGISLARWSSPWNFGVRDAEIFFRD